MPSDCVLNAKFVT